RGVDIGNVRLRVRGDDGIVDGLQRNPQSFALFGELSLRVAPRLEAFDLRNQVDRRSLFIAREGDSPLRPHPVSVLMLKVAYDIVGINLAGQKPLPATLAFPPILGLGGTSRRERSELLRGITQNLLKCDVGIGPNSIQIGYQHSDRRMFHRFAKTAYADSQCSGRCA